MAFVFHSPALAAKKKIIQEHKAQAEIIQKIEFKGNKRIEKEAILEKIGSKVGEALSKERVREDILTLHQMGFFNSISVDFDNGVLHYTFVERPSIEKIIFYGNNAVSTDDLKEVLKIKTYDLFDENLIRESVRELTKYYEDKGFYLAKINYDVRFNEKNETAQVLFNIKEFDKVKVRRITFLGNKRFSDDQLKRVLRQTAEGHFFSWLTGSGSFKELDFKNDMQMLQYFYLNEGYVKFRNEPPIVEVSEDKKWVYITIRVDEGERYHMGTIDFSGDLLFSDNELRSVLTLKEGDWFSISKRNADILAMTEKYQDLGYAHANVVPNMEMDDERKIVITNYGFEKGTLVHFGRINVKSNTKTRDKVVRRELKIREGELYTGTGMRESKENVERLGFFEPNSVEFVTTSAKNHPDIMDVEIRLKERSTGQFQLGAGYGTVTKFFFTTEVAETNFMGRGQDLRFSARFSNQKNSRDFSISFTDPYAFDTTWSLGGSIFYTISPYPTYARYATGFNVRVGHPIGEYDNFFLGYKHMKIHLNDVSDTDYYTQGNLDRENGTLASLTATVIHDKRNNRMEPTKGNYASVSEEFAGFYGNRKFFRTIGEGRYFKNIIGDLIFRTKAELGNVQSWDGKQVQSTEKFYLGGADNLRGYQYFSVSPSSVVPKGDGTYVVQPSTGALNEAFYMAELEYPLIREVGLKGVVFYDVGDAFDKFNQAPFKQDWGFGFRWFSPMGPLRFEWGYPINPKNVDSSVFWFTIGPPF